MGVEAFWPMPLDQECEKAAAILRAFTKDAVRPNNGQNNANGPPQRAGNNTKAIMEIPPKVIAQATGLAIFTVFRTGFHISGSGGAGILIARMPDGSESSPSPYCPNKQLIVLCAIGWGPPSGILMHTLGLGFLIGIDVYDTVLVLRTPAALNAFAHPKVSLGAELSVAAGPVGQGGAIDVGVTDGSPAWVYTKSKGFYAGIAMDGTVVVERKDENERFYGRKITAAELIQGGARRPPSTDGLVRMIEMAEGRRGVDQGGWVQAPPPGPSGWEQDQYQGQKESYSGAPPPPMAMGTGSYFSPPGPYRGGEYMAPAGPPDGQGSYYADSTSRSPPALPARNPSVMYQGGEYMPPPGPPDSRESYYADPNTRSPPPLPTRPSTQSQSPVQSQFNPAQSQAGYQAASPSQYAPPPQNTSASENPFDDEPPAYPEDEIDQHTDITLGGDRKR